MPYSVETFVIFVLIFCRVGIVESSLCKKSRLQFLAVLPCQRRVFETVCGFWGLWLNGFVE